MSERITVSALTEQLLGPNSFKRLISFIDLAPGWGWIAEYSKELHANSVAAMESFLSTHGATLNARYGHPCIYLCSKGWVQLGWLDRPHHFHIYASFRDEPYKLDYFVDTIDHATESPDEEGGLLDDFLRDLRRAKILPDSA